MALEWEFGAGVKSLALEFGSLGCIFYCCRLVWRWDGSLALGWKFGAGLEFGAGVTGLINTYEYLRINL